MDGLSFVRHLHCASVAATDSACSPHPGCRAVWGRTGTGAAGRRTRVCQPEPSIIGPLCAVPGSSSPLFKQEINIQGIYSNSALPRSWTRSWSPAVSCWACRCTARRSHRKQKNSGLLGVLIRATIFALCPVPRGNNTSFRCTKTENKPLLRDKVSSK